MFIFVPVAAGITWLLRRSMKKRPGLYWTIFGLSICLMIGFGVGTFQRNSVWRTERSLWADAYQKAPSMHRPVHNLAMALYERNGRFREALQLYSKADDLTMHRRSHRAWLYSNIANIHYRTGRFELAKEYYLKAHTIAPKKDLIRYRLAETLVRQKKFTAALNHVEALLERNPQKSEYLNLKGNILLQQMMPQRALAIYRANLRFNPHQASAYVNVGRALSAMGRYDQAEKLIKMGNSLDQENLKIYVRLLDIYLKRGDNNNAGDLSRFLVDSAAASDIRLTVEELAEEPYVTADNVNNMLNVLALELQNRLINTHR
jgi:tetratricopeptide (TPR) repeat protein